MTVVSLSLTEDYAPSWGVWEGTRELLQNWHDGCLENAAAAGCCSVHWESQAREVRPEHSLERFEAISVDGRSVGTAVYDPQRERLMLVNRDVGLQRHVLLLGSSRKALAAESIGQFGEGMKVGALALLREGRRVEMTTRGEHWLWTRREDPAFGVRVLSVEVSSHSDAAAAIVTAEALADGVDDGTIAEPIAAASAASVRSFYQQELRLGDADTCTLVSPVTPTEWRNFASRFLFLEPPTDSFRCELGALA